MNQQERDMIEGLFQRLQQADAQAGPRDAEAEALIRERMAAQPGAAYLLAQVVLVQEQGLRNLQTRVEQLERDVASRPQADGGFLAGLLGSGTGGGRSPAPAAPATQGPAAAAAEPPASGWTNTRFPPRPAAGMQPGAMGTGAGGGFLAGAMQTAVGVAGGVLLANAVSGLFHEAEAAEQHVAAADEPASDAGMDPGPDPAIDLDPAAGAPEDDDGLFGDLFGGGDELF